MSTLLACSPRRDLSSLFPDAQRALGPFAIQVEKSRDTNLLSEAKVRVEQGAVSKHITLRLRMIQSQEHVTLSFRPQSMPEESFNARCTPPSDGLVEPSPNRMSILPDTSALFHIPLPPSIRDAKDVRVQGTGDPWAIQNGNLLWDPKQNSADAIEINWTRSRIPETRYPLQTQEKPLHLTALRVDGDEETKIPVTWRAGYVWVSAQDVQADSWLELRFDVPGTDQTFVLPQEPLAEGMKALVMAPECQRENFILEKTYLSWNCKINQGPVWAASYAFHHTMGAMDFSDWPELARLEPTAVTAAWDAGEELSIETYGSRRIPSAVPEEARRVCMRATWTSDLPRESMTESGG